MFNFVRNKTTNCLQIFKPMPKIILANGDYGTAGYEFEPAVVDINLETFLWRLLLLTALAYFIWNDNISINIGHFAIQKPAMAQQFLPSKTDFFGLLDFHAAQNKGLFQENEPINNLTFATGPSASKRQTIATESVNQRIQCCNDFVKQFSPVAIAEMRRFGIPASILLAQALLASDAGTDSRALKTNNFFLKNCENNACTAFHLEEFDLLKDTTHLDVYPNLWGSFRAQSHFLSNQAPYLALIKSHKKDIRSWTTALDTTAYSKDKQYGKKLLALIYTLKLDKFDSR